MSVAQQNQLMRTALERIVENGENGLWPASWQVRHARETLAVVDAGPLLAGKSVEIPACAQHDWRATPDYGVMWCAKCHLSVLILQGSV